VFCQKTRIVFLFIKLNLIFLINIKPDAVFKYVGINVSATARYTVDASGRTDEIKQAGFD